MDTLEKYYVFRIPYSYYRFMHSELKEWDLCQKYGVHKKILCKL